MSTTPSALVTAIRTKHPGAYDDLSDQELESRVLAKYPQYQDMANSPTMPQIPRPGVLPYDMQYAAGGFTPSVMRGAVKDLATGTGSFLKDLLLKPGMPVTGRGQPGSSLMEKYVDVPAEREARMGQQLAAQGHPIAGAIQQGIAKTVPFVGPPIGQALESMREGNYGGPTAQAVALYAGGKAAKGVAKLPGLPDAVRNTILERTGVKDLAPKLQERAQLASDAVNSAITTRNAAEKVVSAPYEELKNHPAIKQQVLEPSEFRAGAQDIVDSKVKGGKLPAAINEILNTGTTKRSTGPPIMGGHFNLSDPTQLAAFNKMKAKGTFTPQEISRMEGSSAEGIGWEQLKQMKTKLGGEMDSYDGAVSSAAGELYNYLDKNLRGMVDKASKLPGGDGLLEKYVNAQKGYKKFMDDWGNGHPIKNLLFGQDTNKIIDSFTGDTGKRVTDTLRKYGADLTPFQRLHNAGMIKEPFEGAEAKSGLIPEKAMAKQRLGEISETGVARGIRSPWTLAGLLAGIASGNPMHGFEYAGARIGLPWSLGTEPITNWLTKGMSEDLPDIPTKKVAPAPPKK